MARILYGNLVAEARGKIGGLVYTHSASGQVARTKVSPTQPQTPAQQAARSRLSQATKLWATLTQAQRAAWQSAAALATAPTGLGNRRKRNGYQLFVAQCLNLPAADVPALQCPPVPGTLPRPATIELTALLPMVTSRLEQVAIINGGTGYTSEPDVQFNGDFDTLPAAQATLAPTSITGITPTSPGAGYTTTPTVNILGQCTIPAQAVATIHRGQVTTITIVRPGAGYTFAPEITITGGGGAGATAEPTLFPTSVQSINILNAGEYYPQTVTVTFVGGGGRGAAGQVINYFTVDSIWVLWTPNPLDQPNTILTLEATPPYPLTRTLSDRDYRTIDTYDAGERSPVNISNSYIAVWGALPVKTRWQIGIRATVTDTQTGIRSEYSYSTFTYPPTATT